MNEDDLMQIRIDHKLVGVIGLKQTMEEMANQYAGYADDEIGEEIIKRIGAHNYIPNRARPLYVQALVHEFRKYLGQPVDHSPVEGLRIAILGTGCSQCGRMEMDVREALAEMKLAGEWTHVSDSREIGEYGVLGVPALVINGRVVCVGQAPHRNRIKEWLHEALEKGRTS